MPRVVSAGVPMRMPLGFIGGLVSNGMAFLLTVMAASPKSFFRFAAQHALGEHIDQHQVRVGAAGNNAEAFAGKRFGQHFGIGDDLLRVIFELRLHRLQEADRLRRDDVHQRPALHSGEDNLVDGCRELLFARIMPARGPRSVLCVVVVTICACGTGEGCAPPATSPAKCAMSTR